MANPIFRLFSRHAEVDTRTGDVAERPFLRLRLLRARSEHIFADDCESARPSDDIPPGGRGSVRADIGPWLALAP